jgi:hypothetical protein
VLEEFSVVKDYLTVRSIMLIDNYIGETMLTMLSKRFSHVIRFKVTKFSRSRRWPFSFENLTTGTFLDVRFPNGFIEEYWWFAE